MDIESDVNAYSLHITASVNGESAKWMPSLYTELVGSLIIGKHINVYMYP